MIRRLWASREVRRWTLIAYWLMMFVATHWPDIDQYKPQTGWPIPFFGVVMHVGVYGGWVVMWWWFLTANGRRVGRAAVVGLLLGGAAWGAFDELTQAVVAREPAMDDYLSDLAGLLIAVLGLWLLQRRFSRSRAGAARRVSDSL